LSSHHIDKDALIIANGASPKITRTIIKISPLVVPDSAMERVMKLNIKVDVLLGFDRDFDANYYKEHQHPIEITHTRPKQNRLVDYLYERKIAAVNVVLGYRKTHGSYNHQYCSLSRKIRNRDSRRPFEECFII
jgi:thiamine pyrophosphokinase